MCGKILRSEIATPTDVSTHITKRCCPRISPFFTTVRLFSARNSTCLWRCFSVPRCWQERKISQLRHIDVWSYIEAIVACTLCTFPFGKSFIYIWFPYYNKCIQVSFITEMNYAYNIANVITTAIKVAYCNGKQFKLDLVNVHLRNTKNPEDYFTFHSHLDSREKLFFIDFTSRCKSQLDGFFL